ncbi:DUF490 domain-containing protein [Shewanella gelidii]|uniref:DUF490 domain-containing protein n=2 Tax=Shewanella gelidii TaxID=1642821 RepID=A0A917JSK6_9GAMM|nr:DUF490 domain-containing protein [Shewanella gelidii]
MKWCIRGFIYIPITLVVVLALAVGTEFGTRSTAFIVNALTHSIHIEQVSGTLNKQLRAKDVQIHLKGIDISLQDLALHWQPLCLLQNKLCIRSLKTSAANISVTLNPKPDAITDKPVTTKPKEQSLQLPFAIALDESNIGNIRVNVQQHQFYATELKLKAIWDHKGLNIDALRSDGFRMTLRENVESQTASNQIVPRRVNKVETKNLTPKPSVLPKITMPFPLKIKRAFMRNSQLDLFGIRDHFESLELQGQFHQQQLSITSLELSHVIGQLSLEGQVNFEHNYPLRISSTLQTDGTKIKSNGQFSKSFLAWLPEATWFQAFNQHELTIFAQDDLSNLNFSGHLAGENTTSFKGKVDVSDPKHPFSLEISDSKYQGQLKTSAIEVSEFSANISGDILQQSGEFSSQGKFANTIWHNFSCKFENQITPQDSKAELSIRALELQTSQSQILLDAELSLGAHSPKHSKQTTAQTFTWQTKNTNLDLQLTELYQLINSIQPDTVTAETQAFAGHIAGTLDSNGTLLIAENMQNIAGSQHNDRPFENQWQVEINKARLKGHIKQLPFLVVGDITLDHALNLKTKAFNARALGSTLRIEGQASEQWQVKSWLSVPDLYYWHPELQGSLQAKIDIDGIKENPQFTLNAQASGLNYGEASLAKTKIKGFYLPNSNNRFAGSFNARQIKLGDIELSSLTLATKGDDFKQKVGIHSFGDLRIDSAIYNNSESTSQWQTEVRNFSVNSVLGQWQIEQPLHLSWKPEQQELNFDPFCLVHPKSQLCLQPASALGKQGKLNLTFDGEIGAISQPLLPAAVRWQGHSKMSLLALWQPNKAPQFQLNTELQPGQISIHHDEENPVALKYQQLNAKIDLDDEWLRSSIEVQSDHFENFQSQIDIGVNTEKTLQGILNLQGVDLALLSAFVPRAETLAGKLSSKLNLSGTLSQPILQGDFSLNKGMIASRANPTLLDHIEIQGLLLGKRAELSGQWQMGDGQSQVQAQFEWPNGKLKGDVRVQGTDLTIIQPPTAILAISPNIELSFTPDHLSVKGEVMVPSGAITIEQLPEGAVDVSSDVIFDDSIAKEQQQTQAMTTEAQLKLIVNDNVSINGLGLKGRLQGTLSIEQQINRPPLVFGDIRVIHGTYKFMGQTLNIDRGELQFVGPSELPNLNIEATREIKEEDITVGVRVSGTPRKPIVQLFSNPTKEQAEIISYIVKGKGLNNQGTDSDALMLSAAQALTSQLGVKAIESFGSNTSELAEKFGFNNVQLDANDDGRFAISGYLGEKLMVKYGVGVLTPGYEITARYFLLSQLYLEAVSGTLGQSLDLYYSFYL